MNITGSKSKLSESLNSKNNKIELLTTEKLLKPKLHHQFTFSLRSSQFSDEHKSQVSDIDLSDLEQDDISKSQQPIPIILPIQPLSTNMISNISQPINIEYGQSQYRNVINNRHGTSCSGSSDNSSFGKNINTLNNKHSSRKESKDSPKTDSDTFSPHSLVSAMKLIKETYDYLSNNNKSL
jgi:hypothetical protein